MTIREKLELMEEIDRTNKERVKKILEEQKQEQAQSNEFTHCEGR